jgi:hypothetical protein
MVAGGNILVQLWRISFITDDEVGGAVPSGTASLELYSARMQGNPDEQLLLSQGLETEHTFTLVIDRQIVPISERDEIEIVYPPIYPYYGQRFRIISVRYSDFTDRRAYTMLTVSRSNEAHGSQ